MADASDPKKNVRQPPANSGGGSVVGESKLSTAMAELKSQHPANMARDGMPIKKG